MTYPQYDSYKDSGQPWLGSIPEHWVTRRVKFLFKIKKRIAGKTGFDVLSITQNGIKVKDITSGGGQLSMDYSKYQIVQKHDFAMNHMDLLTGYVDISNYDGVTSPDYRVFSLSDDKQLQEYFLYIFQMGYKNKIFFALGQGSSQLGRWRFPADEFNNFVVPLPPLEEQKAIAEFIDKKTSQIDTHIDKQERLIALLKERRTAIINKAVTRGLDENVKLKDSGIDWLGEIPEHWEVKKLQYLVKINNAALSDKTKPSKIIQYIDIGQVDGNGLSSEPQKMIFQEAPSRARRKVKYGDVIISTVRTYLKAIAFIESKDDDIIASTGFATLTASKLILPEFLRYAVHNNTFLESVSASSEGIAYPAITANKIGKFKIPYPPSLTEQEKIVKYIDEENRKVDSALNIINKEIAALKEYRQSIISNAVTGKIRVI